MKTLNWKAPVETLDELSISWDHRLARVGEIHEGTNVGEDRVPAAFLCAGVDGQIVGRVSVRFELNDFFAREVGHIGYAVQPPHQRRGYVTEMLRGALAVARQRGLERVLVVCDDTNLAAAAVIDRCDGELECVDGDAEGPYRRY